MSQIEFLKSNLSPIVKKTSLASLLGLSVEQLDEISANVEDYWKQGKVLVKKDGEPRVTNDAKPILKRIHSKINTRILKKVTFPDYVNGGIPKRSITNNAEIHCQSTTVITEDIANFFPSINTKIVFGIWKFFFNFSPEVAELLTKLTTYQDSVPQGWQTSSYIANLVFWNAEPKLVKQLQAKGISYSRFMDDICVSSKVKLDSDDKTFIISKIYTMLFSKGFKPKRSKHEIMPENSSKMITSLNINNKKPTVSRTERRNVKAAINNLKLRFFLEANTLDYCIEWRSLSGKVSRISQYHATLGGKLRIVLDEIKPPKSCLHSKKKKKVGCTVTTL